MLSLWFTLIFCVGKFLITALENWLNYGGLSWKRSQVWSNEKTNLTIGSTKFRTKQCGARIIANTELFKLIKCFVEGFCSVFSWKTSGHTKVGKARWPLPGSKEQITDSQKKHHLSKFFITWRSECAVALLAVNYISYLASSQTQCRRSGGSETEEKGIWYLTCSR